jgi:hypothetical protein
LASIVIDENRWFPMKLHKFADPSAPTSSDALIVLIGVLNLEFALCDHLSNIGEKPKLLQMPKLCEK